MATQQEIATHLGLSLKGARNMLAKLQLDNKTHTIDEIRKAYIANLDETGLSRSGELNATKERVKLMKAQTTKLKLETKKIRSERSLTTILKDETGKSEQASEALDQATSEAERLADILEYTFNNYRHI